MLMSPQVLLLTHLKFFSLIDSALERLVVSNKTPRSVGLNQGNNWGFFPRDYFQHFEISLPLGGDDNDTRRYRTTETTEATA